MLLPRNTSPLQELDELFLNLLNSFQLINQLIPTNLLEEKQKFFDKKFNYNPQFQYKKIDKSNIDNKINLLGSIDMSPIESEDWIKKLYKDRIQELQDILDLFMLIGEDSEAFTKGSTKIYGLPSTKVNNFAKKILKTPKQKGKKKQKLQINQIVPLIQTRLEESNLDTNIVITEKDSNKVSVNSLLNSIYLPKKLTRTKESIEIMLEHELGVHMMRYKNSLDQPYKIFGYGTAGYISTEEGLAVLNSYKLKEYKTLYDPALTNVIMEHAINNDFKSTFNLARTYSKTDKGAWDKTIRIKRGLGDTSEPGLFTKDQYFNWAITTAEEVIKTPTLLSVALAGKASLTELQKLDRSYPINLTIEEVSQILNANGVETT